MADIVPSNTITLPPGITIGPGQPTSQLSATGEIVQGLKFVLTFAQGTKLPVFIPNTMLTNTPAVQAYLDQQIVAIRSITGE